MSEGQNLHIRATADVSEAEKGAKRLGDSMERLKVGLVDTASAFSKIPPSAGPAAAALDKVNSSASKLGGSLSGQLRNGSNQAGQALINLGRVAQDAPFGFIGIQNNINPLLESFQRLKVETGSTKAALSALGSSLLGAGGLGLAVSVATGLLTVLAQRGFFDSGKEAKKAADAIKEYKDRIESIFESVGKEAAQSVNLIAILKNENETRERKLQALKNLKEIQPDIFKGLKLEGDAVVGLDQAYQNYIQSLTTVIAAKIKQAQIESKLTEILKLEGAENTKIQQQQLDSFKKFIKDRNEAAVRKGLKPQLQANTIFGTSDADAKKINQLKKDVAGLVDQLSELSKGIKLNIEKPSKEKAKETIADVLKDLENELKSLNVIEQLFRVDKRPEKVAEIKKTIEKLVKDFGLTGENAIIIDLGFRANFIQSKIDRDRLLQDIQKITTQSLKEDKSGIKGVTIPVKVKFVIGPLQELQEQLAALNKEATKIFQDFGKQTAIALGDAIGQGLSGNKDFIGNFFSGILKALGAGVRQLGIYVISTSKLILAIRAQIGTTLGIAGGIALVALGTLISAAASKISGGGVPGFATGTDNFKGGFAMVGERGPELVRLPAGSGVLSNGRTNAMAASLGGIVIPDVVLRGSDLVLVFDRAKAQLGRST